MSDKWERKAATIELKGDDAPGAFSAEFATLDVVDAHGDITKPGAFKGNGRVLVGAYNHASRWEARPPIGYGDISEQGKKAVVEGEFNLDMASGAETYSSLKFAAEHDVRTEWSYIFQVLEAGQTTRDGETYRQLEKVLVRSIDPVLAGAGVDTRTTSIKSLEGALDDLERVIADAEASGDEKAIAAALERAERLHTRITAAMTSPQGDPEVKKALERGLIRFRANETRLVGALN